MVRYVIATLIRLINIYSFLCFIRIILTWIPGAQYSAPGRILSALCDPFLNIFRGTRWMQIGSLDFSPAISIGLLYALSYILQNILMTGRIYFGAVLAIIIGMAWSIVNSLALFLLVLLVIRFIVILSQKRANYYGSLWSQLDYALEPFVHRISRIFTGNKFVGYKTSLGITIAALIGILAGGHYLFKWLIKIVQQLPF